jgi:hypothetical protein
VRVPQRSSDRVGGDKSLLATLGCFDIVPITALIRTWTRESRHDVPVSIPVPETAPNIEPVPSLRSLSGMFAIASIFAIVGGFLDAYSYLARGGVFANAQTGNVVLFGVRAAAGNWTSACKTLPSILAYMCGVAVARLLRQDAHDPVPIHDAGSNVAALLYVHDNERDVVSLPLVLCERGHFAQHTLDDSFGRRTADRAQEILKPLLSPKIAVGVLHFCDSIRISNKDIVNLEVKRGGGKFGVC